MRIEAIKVHAVDEAMDFSQSLASRLQRSSQANVRSTTRGDIEYRVYNLAHIRRARPSAPFRRGHERHNQSPLDIRHILRISQSLPAMFVPGNTSPCHHSLHLFVKTDESQYAGIVQKLSDQALIKIMYSMNVHVMNFIFIALFPFRLIVCKLCVIFVISVHSLSNNFIKNFRFRK